MSSTTPPGSRRADAQRNRTRLIEAALRAFSAPSDPTLESIARDAGVGIGTLYRHFPTRESLVEAVYYSELTRLCESAEEMAGAMAPETALRGWMERYTDFVATKRGMADALRALIASGAVHSSLTRPRITAAIRTILDAGIASGGLRDDVRAEDVTAALAGVVLGAGSSPDQRDQVGRLLDLLMDALSCSGSRRPAPSTAPG